jgi:hypothetical protein
MYIDQKTLNLTLVRRRLYIKPSILEMSINADKRYLLDSADHETCYSPYRNLLLSWSAAGLATRSTDR